MATLTTKAIHTFENTGNDLVGKDVIATGETLVSGQLVQRGTNATEIRDLQNDATSGFGGLLHGSGAAGDAVDVKRVCRLITSIASTVAAGDEGTAVYADTSGTASNNPADITKTSTNNLPVGKIAYVKLAGSAGANTVVLELRADGER